MEIIKRTIKTVSLLIIIFAFFHFVKLNFLIGIDGQSVRSLSYKIYLIKKSDYIAFYSDKRMTTYFPERTVFIKKVIAKEGDIVNTIGRKYYVNGKFVAEAVQYDLSGKPVKHFIYNNYKLKAGEYFVLGTNKFSYDSRYWGLVYENQIIGEAYPLY